MPDPIIVVSFIIFAAIILVPEWVRKSRGLEVLGTPTIPAWLFYFGKLMMGCSWSFMVLQAAGVPLSTFQVSESTSLLSQILFVAGEILAAVSFLHLGESTRMGLPTNAVLLKTKGLYSVSRNPLYVGAFMMGVGSCLYSPHIVNIAATVAFIVIHHQIVLGEERFLQSRFGEEWVAYTGKVRRYI